MKRRTFLAATGLAPAAYSLASATPALAEPQRTSPTASPKRILVLGGTKFLGPELVKVFLDRGHSVILFNRGKTDPGKFAYLEQLRGDRELPIGEGLQQLKGRNWDVVVDTWQKGPKCVEDSARLLSGNVGAYFYTSSISVYHRDAFAAVGAQEDARLSDLAGTISTREPESEVYYIRKTLAEVALMQHFHGRIGIFRAHGLRGAAINEPVDEPYWPVRLWRGGAILAPEDGSTWGQFTDIASFAGFMAAAVADDRVCGAFNVMSRPFRLREYFSAITQVTGTTPDLRWISRERLSPHGIEPYRDLPMWRPDPPGFYGFDTSKAEAIGFEHRPLAASVASMLEGYNHRNPKDDFVFDQRGNLSAKRETEALIALGEIG